MKVVNFPALHTGCLFLPGHIAGTHFFQRLCRPQGHSVARNFKSMKNLTEPIGNRTRYLPVCSAVPHPTALPRVP